VPLLPPKPIREQCKVLYAYTPQNEDELKLMEGEVVSILSRDGTMRIELPITQFFRINKSVKQDKVMEKTTFLECTPVKHGHLVQWDPAAFRLHEKYTIIDTSQKNTNIIDTSPAVQQPIRASRTTVRVNKIKSRRSRSTGAALGIANDSGDQRSHSQDSALDSRIISVRKVRGMYEKYGVCTKSTVRVPGKVRCLSFKVLWAHLGVH